MSDTLTDDHHDWATDFCGIPTRGEASSEDARNSSSAAPTSDGRTVTIPEVTIIGDPAAATVGGPSNASSADNSPPAGPPQDTTIDPVGSILAPAAISIPAGPPSPGNDPCKSLLQAIIDQLKLLEQLFEEATTDTRRLWEKEKQGIPDDSGTTWTGHKPSYEKERDELRRRIADWDKDCGHKVLVGEEQEEVEMAREYADKEFPDKPEYAKTQQQPVDDKPLVNEGSTFDKVMAVFTVLGLSLLLVPEVVVAVADPEPVTKLVAIGLTAATIAALGKALGFSTSNPPPDA